MRTWQQAIRASHRWDTRDYYAAALKAGFMDGMKVAEQLFWYAVFMAGVFGLGIVIVEAFRHH